MSEILNELLTVAEVLPEALRSQGGFTLAELRACDLSARQLRDAGFLPADFAPFKSASAASGFTAEMLEEAGFSEAELLDVGFTAKDLKALTLAKAQKAKAAARKRK